MAGSRDGSRDRGDDPRTVDTPTSSPNCRPPALRISGLSKQFGPTRALDAISLEVMGGSVHALLGGNGSGKSTLMKVLAGVESADAGVLELADGSGFDLRHMTSKQSWAAGLRFVHQESTAFPDMTVAENLALGARFATGKGGRIRWREQARRAATILDRFEIEVRPDQPLGELSPATRTMVTIARALQDQDQMEQGVLLLDEPTAALPDAEVRLLLSALRRYADAKQTIVYVTHRLEEVFAIADRASLFRDGQHVDTVSPKSVTHDMLVELIMGRAVTRVTSIEGNAKGPVRLHVAGLTAGALRSLEFTSSAGEIVGIAGLIGSGRSSLFRALFGAIPVEAGEMWLDGVRVQPQDTQAAIAGGIVYLPEARADFAFPDLTVSENMLISSLSQYRRLGVLRPAAERRKAHAMLSAFLIKTGSIDSPLRSLSGGNQQKVLLARCMQRTPRLLLLDEPTQGVDVGARAEILQLIQAAVRQGTTALLASSDFEELAMVCNRAIVLRSGTKLGELSGEQLTASNLHRLAHSEMRATT